MKYFVFAGIFIIQVSVAQDAYQAMLDRLYDYTVPLLTVEELDSLRSEGVGFVLLDTRSPEEFSVSHIPKAQFLHYEQFDAGQWSHLPKDKPIVLYCSVGYRSEKIGEELRKNGYDQVYNLKGGIFQWKNNEYEVVNSQNMVTDSVHTYDENWGQWLRKGVKVH